MGLPTAERLAKAIGVSVGTFSAALERTLNEREEFLRRWAEAERVRREAELGEASNVFEIRSAPATAVGDQSDY
jgi:hypothetical protein